MEETFLNYLVDCENTKNLPRLSASLSELLPAMKELQLRAGVSDNERKTLECEALGLHLPKDVKPARIANFPTPGKVIPNVRMGSKQKMLKCLYPEYQYLSSSVHGSSQFAIYKICFDDRKDYKDLFTSGDRETLFARVAEPALIIDYLSIIQTCTELSTLYPDNYSFREALILSWDYILNKALLGAIMWETRTRQLLGVIEKTASAGVQFSPSDL